MPGDTIVIQGSAAAVFSGAIKSDVTLTCNTCKGAVLIENYQANAYFGFGIQCFGCEGVTTLPGVPDGDILPKPVLSLGDGGRFLVSSTCNVPPGVVVATDQEIRKQDALTAPTRVAPEAVHLEPLLDETERIYEESTGQLERHMLKIERNLAAGNEYAAEKHPLIWSVVHLRKRLSERTIDLRSYADRFAIASVVTFQHMLPSWKRHPRFREISSSLGDATSFNHHMAVLTAASYLHRAGNAVTFDVTQHGTRTADLYVRSGTDKIAVEVKAPLELHWPRGKAANVRELEDVVRNQLKRARGQLDRNHPGILVIAAGIQVPEMSEALKRAIENVIASGVVSSGIIAVTAMTQVYHLGGVGNALNAGVETTFEPVQNPKYSGTLRLVPERAPWSVIN